MKKILTSLTIILIFTAALNAESLFSYELLPSSPLYREPLADPYSYSTYVRGLFALDNEQRPNRIDAIVLERDRTTGEERTFYSLIPYDTDGLKEKNNKYINMKTGVTVGLSRVRFNGSDWIPPLDFELDLAGYINNLFTTFSGADNLDFDGSFFFGASTRIGDTVTLRFGIHHFSGHYGDEVLKEFYSYNQVDFTSSYNGSYLFNYALSHPDADKNKDYYLAGLVEYVRDNSYSAAVSASLPWGFRVYTEAELPMNPSWLRPFVHVPAGYSTKVKGEDKTLIERIGGNEHITEEQIAEEESIKSNTGYRAWRLHCGLEWKWEFSSLSVFAAFDIQFHQDGQTKHTPGGYSPSNPWETEITLGGGIEIASRGTTKVRFEAYYHNGRVPAPQWFYQRMSSITLGVGVN